MSLRHFKRQKLCSTSENVKEKICVATTSLNPNVSDIEQLEPTINNCINADIISKIGISNDEMTSFQEFRCVKSYALGSNTNNVCVNKNNIKDKLQQWVLVSNVPKNDINSLLQQILRSEGMDLPKDVRTLMNTPRSHEIININPGTYIHLGLKKMLLIILNFNINNLKNLQEVFLSFNIDGLPLAHSSKQQFWPILCSIINVPQLSKLVFAVGLYFSTHKKPESIEDFFNLFINEAVELANNGICFNNKVIRINIKQVICDSPAKAFLLNVKGHNAHVGCTTCTEEGEYKENRMAFLEVNALLRTDEF